MIYVGVDISLNSTGICISDGDKFKFLSLTAKMSDRRLKTSVTTKAYRQLLDSEEFRLERFDRGFHSLTKKEKDDYSTCERTKVEDAKRYAGLLYDSVTDIIDKDFDYNGKIIIGTEGISYGSRGQALIDICGASYLIRDRLSELGTLYFYAPSAVKKFAGRELDEKTGGAGKLDMYEMFIENSLKDSALEVSDFYKKLTNPDQDWAIRKGKLSKPLDDLIDSYFICKMAGEEK